MGSTPPPAHRVHLLVAGETRQLGRLARRGGPWRMVGFPALVAVIEHADGVVLVDTGYTPRAVAAASHGIDRLYSALLPVRVEPEQTLLAQLARLGLGPVTDVVLTHLHLDHVGGLADLLEASAGPDGRPPRVVVDRGSLEAFRSARGLGRVAKGWVTGTVPPGVEQVVTDPGDLPLADSTWADLRPLPAGRDLLGDASVVVLPLSGHADGHLGVLVRAAGRDGTPFDLLLLGDAAWDLRAVTERALPALPVRLISHDWPGYVATIDRVAAAARRRPDLRLLPAHDEPAIERVRAELA